MSTIKIFFQLYPFINLTIRNIYAQINIYHLYEKLRADQEHFDK